MDLSIVEQAIIFEITDKEGYEFAGNMWKSLWDLEKEIESSYKPLKEKAWAAHKAIVAEEKKRLDPVTNAKAYIKSKMSEYNAEIERKRIEAQRLIEAELMRKEEERILAEAEAAEKAGYEELAESILSAPVSVPVVELPNEKQKVEGLSWREVWMFRITDESLIPREYLMPDTTKIGKFVRAMKQTAKIPGIMAYTVRV